MRLSPRDSGSELPESSFSGRSRSTNPPVIATEAEITSPTDWQ